MPLDVLFGLEIALLLGLLSLLEQPDISRDDVAHNANKAVVGFVKSFMAVPRCVRIRGGII